KGARIIASRASAEEMDAVPPALMAEMLRRSDELGAAGTYFRQSFGAFEFEGITPTPPTETFERRHSVSVGNKSVELLEVGPAHTRGDILVHVPEDEIIFTGDILFIDGTPILWEGPIANWITACDRILELKPKIIVPGHGPLTDLKGVHGVREYLEFIRDEARLRFEAGLSASDAARDIALGRYSSWLDSERIVINVQTLYREFDPQTPQANLVELFGLMAELADRDKLSL
ncbi:MAG: MBL fold metallo-hydrolase, partial [Myxococcota bacterium]|nr:MBL fold metallo-hydrolase [Myxococcota bacterium]